MMATNTSSISEEPDDAPFIDTDASKGSSVSTDMEDEYNQLLKYAVVVPKWSQDPTAAAAASAVRSDMPMLRLHQPDDVPYTTIDEYSGSSSSSSRSNDAHDSAMGSEVTSDRKTFRENLHDAKGVANEQPLIYQSTTSNRDDTSRSNADPDVAQMNEQLKSWNARFNNMVLSEFNQAKIGVVEHYQRLLRDQEMEHQAQVNKLQDEIENMKELLHTYETSLARKDSVISNLTRALQTSKERQDMMRALSTWKLRLNDERRQAFTTNLARRHREHVLAARVWQSWRALVEGSWREKVEKACQRKAQEVCMQLTDDYEQRMAQLNEVLADSSTQVNRLNAEREKYEETMKKAFMRGVCALNLEAMTMFHNEEGAENEVQALSGAMDALSHHHGDHPTRTSANRPMGASHSQPSLHQYGATVNRKPTTVISQPTVNLPMTNPIHHNADVTAHARTQIAANRAPLQPVSSKLSSTSRPKTSRRLNGKASTCGGTGVQAKTSQILAGIPANVLVKRHQPNLQNHAIHQPLKHMQKYPNTPARPISGQ